MLMKIALVGIYLYNKNVMNKKNIFSLMSVFFCVFFFSGKTHAQQRSVSSREQQLSLGSTQVNGYRQNIFKSVKMRIANMLLDNRKLERQYADLKKEFLALKDEFDQKTYSVGRINQDARKVSHRYRNQQDQLETFNNDIQDLQDEKLLLTSQVIFLKGEMIDLDEKVRMRKLKLADLQFEKRERAMELKLDRFAQTEEISLKRKTLKELENQLEVDKLQQVNLQFRIEEMSEDASSPYKIERFKQDISDLEYRIKDLEKQREFKLRKMANLKSKRLFSKRSFDSGIEQKQKERDDFERIVAELQAEHDAIAMRVTGSLEGKQKKQVLVSQLIGLDQENQELRDSIAQLRENLVALEK